MQAVHTFLVEVGQSVSHSDCEYAEYPTVSTQSTQRVQAVHAFLAFQIRFTV